MDVIKSNFESIIEQRSVAADYARSEQQSRKTAFALEVAAIFIENVDANAMNRVMFGVDEDLRERGLLREGDTLESLQQEALQVVREKAASEGSIADHQAATRDRLL